MKWCINICIYLDVYLFCSYSMCYISNIHALHICTPIHKYRKTYIYIYTFYIHELIYMISTAVAPIAATAVAPHTPRFRLYTAHFTFCILHFTLYSILHTLHSTLQTLHLALHTLHSTLYTLRFTLYTPHFALCT